MVEGWRALFSMCTPMTVRLPERPWGPSPS